MAVMGGMQVPGGSTLGTEATNWTQQASTTTDECSSITDPTAKRQCRQEKRQREAGANVQTKMNAGSDPAAAGQYNPGSGSVTPTGGFDSAIGQSTARAPAGSYAAGLGTYGLGTAGSNPEALVQNYMSGKYGVASNSAATGIANKYLAPTDARVQAILGELPGSNIDAANFGAALMDQLGGSLGAQLDPKRMTATITAGVQAASGLGLDPEDVGPGGFSSVANNPDPLKGLDSLTSMLAGALVGTMSDTALSSWLDSLTAYATQFITGAGGMMNQTLDQIAGDEGANNNWFDKLVATLGPTLGL